MYIKNKKFKFYLFCLRKKKVFENVSIIRFILFEIKRGKKVFFFVTGIYGKRKLKVMKIKRLLWNYELVIMEVMKAYSSIVEESKKKFFAFFFICLLL